MRGERLVVGTSGNASVREAGATYCLVTPSGVEYDSLRPADLVTVELSGSVAAGQLKPSTDVMNHLAIYRARRDVCAILHTHSPYTMAFSVLHRDIPPLLAEAAGFLGGGVRVMEYVPFGRPEAADRLAEALRGHRAVLLPNHGAVVVGESLGRAFVAAVLVEQSARVALLASLLGEPRPLPESEVERLHEFIHHRYGQPSRRVSQPSRRGG